MDTRLENRIIPPAASGVILRPGNSLRTSSCILVIRIRFFESVLVTCFLFIEHTYQQKSRSWSSKSSPFHPTGGGLHPEQGRFISLPDSDYTRYTFTFASSSSHHLDTDCGNWDILDNILHHNHHLDDGDDLLQLMYLRAAISSHHLMLLVPLLLLHCSISISLHCRQFWLGFGAVQCIAGFSEVECISELYNVCWCVLLR